MSDASPDDAVLAHDLDRRLAPGPAGGDRPMDPLLLIGVTPDGQPTASAAAGVSLMGALTLCLRLAERLEAERCYRLWLRSGPGASGRLIDWIAERPNRIDLFRRARRLGRDRGYPSSLAHWDADQVADVLHELRKPGRGSSRWGGSAAGGTSSAS